MIISIQGYNRKKNDAVKFAASFGDFLALQNKDSRIILLQLLNNDEDNAEDMLKSNKTPTDLMARNDRMLPILEQSIDGLLNALSNQSVNDNFLNTYRKTVISYRSKDTGKVIKTVYDVIPISKNENFVQNIEPDTNQITELINALNSENMYNYVIVVCDPKSKILLKAINDMADKSIYCLNQRFVRKGEVFGKDITYCLPAYSSDSMFSLKRIKENYGFSKKDKLFKIEDNPKMQDAAYNGTLHDFITKNLDITSHDSNYRWSEDMKSIVDAVVGKGSSVDTSIEGEHFENDDVVDEESFATEINFEVEEPQPEKKTFFSRLFKAKAKKEVEKTSEDIGKEIESFINDESQSDEDMQNTNVASVESEVGLDLAYTYPTRGRNIFGFQEAEMSSEQDDISAGEIELTESELKACGEIFDEADEEEIDLSNIDTAASKNETPKETKKKGFRLFSKKEDTKTVEEKEAEVIIEVEKKVNEEPKEVAPVTSTSSRVPDNCIVKEDGKRLFTGVNIPAKKPGKIAFTSIN